MRIDIFFQFISFRIDSFSPLFFSARLRFVAIGFIHLFRLLFAKQKKKNILHIEYIDANYVSVLVYLFVVLVFVLHLFVLFCADRARIKSCRK